MIISTGNKKYLICIVGPTAIGKTTLSIALAKYFNTEIISADSRQFYKEMSIGTAVPSSEELAAVRHHFIQHKSIQDNYNVGAFESDALSILQTLFQSHDIAIMVGGSGLYVEAVINGLDVFPEIDPTIRSRLNERLASEGKELLSLELKQLDPKAYEQIDSDNPRRIIRALEVCLGTGKPYSSFLKKSSVIRPFETILIGLDADRPTIYERIEQRVDLMINDGLVEEARHLMDERHLNALNTVGYKELFQYFDNTWTLEFAISEIKKNTRRFAKRQLTWFKKNKAIHWFNFQTPTSEIIKLIAEKIKKSA